MKPKYENKTIQCKTRESFRKIYKTYEDDAVLVNFRGEPFNWPAFCRCIHNGKVWQVKPHGDSLTITITESQLQAEDCK